MGGSRRNQGSGKEISGKSEIEKWVTASGGKAVVSQLEAIKNLGISTDPQETLAQIQKEDADASRSRISNIFEEPE